MDNVKANIDGSWRNISKGYCNIDGTWKSLPDIMVNIDGVWKKVGKSFYTAKDVLNAEFKLTSFDGIDYCSGSSLSNGKFTTTMDKPRFYEGWLPQGISVTFKIYLYMKNNTRIHLTTTNSNERKNILELFGDSDISIKMQSSNTNSGPNSSYCSVFIGNYPPFNEGYYVYSFKEHINDTSYPYEANIGAILGTGEPPITISLEINDIKIGLTSIPIRTVSDVSI